MERKISGIAVAIIMLVAIVLSGCNSNLENAANRARMLSAFEELMMF